MFFSRQMFYKDFLPVWGSLFILLAVSFEELKLILMKCSLLIFLLLKMVLLVSCLCLTQGHKYFLLRFLLKVL